MDCHEAVWRKAGRSHDDGDQCVEIASVAGDILVRDSKHPDGPKVVTSSQDFQRFAETLKGL
ncbi:DUF397 domain-containing protein [Spirillospora sp. NPDC029432]|uniref:DUF397 domain-containing protein n=1 Tax=Spirillospora sp. NPDC029432 TaxID=3154599 RepID=UPI003455C78E